MAHRTNTTNQTLFCHPDQGITLEFVDPKRIKMTLAADGGWRSPHHWHPQNRGCSRIYCLRGHLLVSYSTPHGGSGLEFIGPGDHWAARPGLLHSWRSRDTDHELVALLETEDEVLYHNASSATLDAVRFPYFASTPIWVRLLFLSLTFWPAAQRLMITRLLWIQLQMMYYAHDFLMYHGSIHALYLWRLVHPFTREREPSWVYEMEWWSLRVISRATHGACYWLGRLFLGMKAEYPEYTPGDTATTGCNIEAASLDSLKTTFDRN